MSLKIFDISGANPGFFLGGGALISCSTSTPINHIFFFLQNTSSIRKPQVISGGGGWVRNPCTLPLDPPLYIARQLNPGEGTPYTNTLQRKLFHTYWQQLPENYISIIINKHVSQNKCFLYTFLV